MTLEWSSVRTHKNNWYYARPFIEWEMSEREIERERDKEREREWEEDARLIGDLHGKVVLNLFLGTFFASFP